MRSRLSLLAVIVTFCVAGYASTLMSGRAEAQISNSKSVAATDSVAVIVELESDPVAVRQRARMPLRLRNQEVDFEAPDARAYENSLSIEQSNFTSRARLVVPALRERTRLRRLANAVSIEIPAAQVTTLSALPGVKRVEVVKEYHTLLDTSVPLINAPALWSRLGGQGVAGDGIKIAIVDTGIDITNPMFSDDGYTMPPGFPRTNNGSDALVNKKVIAAKSYLPGSPNAADGNGHGSNVAGIAAGNAGTVSPLGVISGVAPRAYLGNYRVLNASGSGRDDFIATAIEDAVSDGFDVISMSLGADADDTLSLLDRTVETAVNVGGKIVVVAAGNSGEGGVDDEMTIASPGVAPSAITVAAATNAHVVGPIVSVDGPQPVTPALSKVTAVLGTGGSAAFDGSFAGVPFSEVTQNRACSALTAGSLNGAIALIERGNCTFTSKVNAAAAAGAKGVIIYNNDITENPDTGGDNLVTMDVTGTSIPSIFVSRSNGLALRDWVRSAPSTTVSVSPVGSGPAVADVLAPFSSRGPSSLGQLKPDVTAPGVIIYSAAIRTANADGVSDPSGFRAVSGTSQATPHVAGAAALIKQLNPSFTPLQVKSVLMNSATTDVFTTTSKATRWGVLAAGAGRIDLERASSIGATLSPANLSFGINKLKKKDVTLTADLAVTSQLDGQNTFGVGIEQLDPGDLVTLSTSANSVTLNRGESRTVTITIFAGKGAEKRDYTGYVVITDPSNNKLRVPFWVRYRKKL